jgi:hypothetical protein
VNKGEAILNLPEERVIPLDASHRDMVKPESMNSPVYRTIRNCLKNVLSHLERVRPIVTPPISPPPTSRIGTSTIARKVPFHGYIHLFTKNVLDEAKKYSISDLSTKAPGALLDSSTDSNVEDPLIWIHLPLNNTSWVNVSKHSIVHGSERGAYSLL